MTTSETWNLDASRAFDLTDQERVEAQRAPEDGPGYQLAGGDDDYVVFNGEVAVPIERLTGGDRQSDSGDVLVQWSRSFADYDSFRQNASPRRPGQHVRFARKQASPRGTLVVSYVATVTTDVVRFTAYRNDRRVIATPAGFTVSAGTYVVPRAERRHVSTGLGAVGRCALPNPFPASWFRWLHVPAGTGFSVGTVRPNFGQAGGGVEIVLPGLTAVASRSSGRVDSW